MYEAHFQMHRRPFPPSADVSTYVGIGPVEQAGQTLLRVIQRASGPGLVIGGAGMGKSMLCELLAEHFGQEKSVALLANGQLANPRALFQAIHYELGLPYRELDENELRLSLVDFLADTSRCSNGLLLIVDEAHALPLRLLEEIRMLTNLARDGQSRVHLVLAGGPALEERFASPKLDSFNQRVAARCYLESLNRDETKAYIREQVLMAGGDPDTAVGDDAMGAVYDATDGIPRLVNQLCDHVLIMAAVGGHTTVTAAIVQEAWADLQQLPTPWIEPASAASNTPNGQHVVEFGSLDETHESPAESIPFAPPAEPVAAEAEPTAMPAEEQLDAIEQQISTVTESFSEEGDEVFRHEPDTVEIAAVDPFAEAFDEEEVVIDSYASLQETRFNKAPRVSSVEGSEIAALLASATDKAEAVTAAAESKDDPESQSDTVAEACELQETETQESDVSLELPVVIESSETEAAEGPQETAQVFEEAARRRQQELTDAVASLLQDSGHDETEEELEAVPFTEPEAQNEPQLSIVGSESAELPSGDLPSGDLPGDDRDLIIVEEAPSDDVDTHPHVAQGKARRQKYRQLFNRLRQA